jgi:ABC-type Fe3+-hydroxamate transport system substrate-binding protein
MCCWVSQLLTPTYATNFREPYEQPFDMSLQQPKPAQGKQRFEVTFERLASLNPDVLIVHGEKKEEKKKLAAFGESPEFSKLKAVKNGRVLVYSCDDICHPNADIADTVEMVA